MTINSVLLHPANRLLQGGTADFAMFGGQPTTVSIARPQATDSGYVTAFSDQLPAASRPDAHVPAEAATVLYTGLPAGSGVESGGSLDATLTPPLAGMPDLPAAPAASAPTPAPLVPDPSGAGSLAPVAPVIGPLSGASGDHSPGTVTASAFGPPVLDVAPFTPSAEGFALAAGLSNAVLAPVVALAESGAAAAAGTITTTLAGVGDVVAATEQAIGVVGTAATETLHDGVAGVTDLAGDSVAGIASLAHDSIAGVADLTQDSLATVTDATQDSVAAVGDLAQGGVASAAEFSQTSVTAVSDTVGSTSQVALDAAQDSITATVMPLVDHLSGDDGAADAAATDVLAGVDPTAGIATLTAMVGSSDVFEVTPAIAAGLVDTAASALDSVPTDGEAASPLLGQDHGVADLLHHDDAHAGIGGL